MYVLGVSDYNFIKITKQAAMYDGSRIWEEVRKIEHDVPLHEATIISDYEKAKDILEEIKENAKEIQFTNYRIIDEIIDKKHEFNKSQYINNLKIFELQPKELT